MTDTVDPRLQTRATELFGVRFPIVQTGMGWVAGASLVSGTANAGGLGILAAATMTFDEMVEAGGDTKDMFAAYNVTHFHPGQTSTVCPTGVQFPTAVDDALGAAPYMPGGKMRGSAFDYMIVDKLKVPLDLPTGDYHLSWRWDCEETPQVWNSCADLTIA